jgi:hypothetical protein
MDDHRQHPRYAIELDAEITTADARVVGRTGNISRGGFCLLADAPLASHAACEVKLALVFEENQFSEQLKLPASVAWCTPLGGRYQIGVQFSPLTPQSRAYLDLFMKFLEEEEAEPEPDS